jgi:hypothetical protein
MNLEVLPGCYSFYSFQNLDSLKAQKFDDSAFICSIPGDYSLMVTEGIEVRGFETVETSWRCMTIPGQMAFSETGVAAAVTSSLAAAGVSVLVMSGYKTDYFFVKSELLDSGVSCLRQSGHQVAT